MNYYLVAVGSNKYHGQEPLTYAFEASLKLGDVVSVPLRNNDILGYVIGTIDKPEYKTKMIIRNFPTIPPLPHHLLSLFSWMLAYYPAPLGITAQLFLPKHMPSKEPASPQKSARGAVPVKPLPQLTTEQSDVIESMQSSGMHVLHGETGSGKTRVYIELALQAYSAGKSSLILTPEISLTTQLTERFMNTFGPDRVIVLHSSMTDAARRKAWLFVARATEPIVAIGARSALFSPIHNLGLIVLDESHETSYKQENAPHYHATRVASKLAELCGAQVVLGTATPSINDYFLASERKRPILRLSSLATGTASDGEVTTRVIDMRDRSTMSRNPNLSNALIDAINTELQNGRQTMLFLNRRGTARIVLCNACGWQAVCPHCDLPLTYHHDSHSLRCHACSHKQPAITSCLECGNPDITLKSVGTKTIASTVERLFPSARVQRFDADNLAGDRVHEQYESIHSGAIDILVGTQLLAKGFDLPKLGLIGVINADASLHIPDFTAQERTYQLLYQVLGRVGRGHQAGQAIIQTYSPDDPTIQAAIRKDWSSFYKTELQERRTFLFPPYCHMLKVSCQRASVASAMRSAEHVREVLESKAPTLRIEGPAPAFHEKVRGKYVWQLVLKSTKRSELLQAITYLPKDWQYDIDPIDLL